jgi:hypothetical protein
MSLEPRREDLQSACHRPRKIAMQVDGALIGAITTAMTKEATLQSRRTRLTRSS